MADHGERRRSQRVDARLRMQLYLDRLVDWPKEAPTGKRSVYINHSTKKTSWKPPPAWHAWELLKQPVDSARHLVLPQLLLAYKDLFRVSGDKSAELYTGSPAMHSSQLDLLLVRAPSPSLAPCCGAQARSSVHSACSQRSA